MVRVAQGRKDHPYIENEKAGDLELFHGLAKVKQALNFGVEIQTKAVQSQHLGSATTSVVPKSPGDL